MRWVAALAVSALMCGLAHAGGPEFVAGASYFDPATKGMAVTWAQGSVTYYTDQGDLSAILLGPSADSFVANAFAEWTAIPTAAVAAVHGGQLAEDGERGECDVLGRRGEYASGYLAECDGDSGGNCLRLRRRRDGRAAGDGRE